jgi:phenylalanine ammonia-lyase
MGGAVLDGASALRELNLQPIELQPKEGLALVNGTSFSAAIAANASNQARHLLAVSFATQAMMMTALQVDRRPFDAFVHAAKPHPGQVWSAKMMRQLLTDGVTKMPTRSAEVQDCYSLRCFPQYTGAIVEGIARTQSIVATEMNGVSDNPLVDPETGNFYQSGNFLGQYVAMAMDDLRRDIGLLAKHLDVQIALLVAPEFNKGLSPSLRGNDDRHYNMGLKGLQICGNSIMPMLTYYGQPLTHHYPTHAEQYNQNINGLSWGSANLAWQSVKIFSQYLSVSLLCSVQALDLRARQMLGHFDGAELLGRTAREVYHSVLELLNTDPDRSKPFLFNDSDRWLERDIEILAQDLFAQGDLIQKVEPILKSFDEDFEAGA